MMQSASPVHGQNQWPHQIPAFEAVLRQYISGCLSIGQAVMRGMLQDTKPSMCMKTEQSFVIKLLTLRVLPAVQMPSHKIRPFNVCSA